MQKYKNKKENEAAILSFSKLSTSLNHSISLDTNGPRNPATGGYHYIIVIVDPFGKSIVTVAITKRNAHYAVHTLINNNSSK